MLTMKSANTLDGIYDVIITNIFISDGFVLCKNNRVSIRKVKEGLRKFLMVFK